MTTSNTSKMLTQMIGDAKHELNHIERSIEMRLDDLQKVINDTRNALADGEGLNAMGVIKTYGPEVDRLVALRQVQRDRIVELQFLTRLTGE